VTEEAVIMTIFGSLISALLAILALIGHSLRNEVKELSTKVSKHGEAIASMQASLSHFERRHDLGA
jgi:hypothetical protein